MAAYGHPHLSLPPSRGKRFVKELAMDAAVRKHIEVHLPEYLEDLKRLCAQSSVAAQNDGVQNG